MTPPVCLAAFTAAGIAKSPPMATGVEAWKIAKGLYIVVLLFAFTPLIGAGFWDSVQIGGFAMFGLYAATALLQRHSEGPIPLWLYPALAGGGILCFLPLELPLNCLGALLVAGTVVVTSRRQRRTGDPASGRLLTAAGERTDSRTGRTGPRPVIARSADAGYAP